MPFPSFSFVRVAVSVVLAMCACHERPDLEEEEGEAQNRSAPWPAPARYIGVLGIPNGGCEDEPSWIGTPPPRWAATPLFDMDALTLMPLLSRYCVYTWTGPGGPAAFSNAFVATHVRLDPDANILVPQAEPSQVRAERTLQALGASLASPLPPLGWSDSGVYVAIVDNVDSSPPGQLAEPIGDVPPSQLHGSVMRGLIDTVHCPFGNTCRMQHFFAQAFPYDSSSAVPLASGGELGSLGSLATAIGESVTRWKTVNVSGDWHLVINMSVGWDPAFEWSPDSGEPSEDSGEMVPGATETGSEPGATETGSEPGATETGSESGATETGSEPGEMLPSSGAYDLSEGFDAYGMLTGSDASVPAPVQAVYAALAWAACEGALSIAAAGNNRGPRCEQQEPMAPASWEVHAISAQVCQAFELFPQLEIGGPPVPLVHAAGGLDAADRPIANARLGSMPRLALHAFQVNVDGGHPDPLTGTSLSAAALSAIAAQLWSQQPHDSATEIMERLHASGEPLGLAVEWGGSKGDPVRRIDAHAALAAAGVGNPYLPRISAAATGPSGSLGAALDEMIDSRSYASFVPTVTENHTTQDTGCAPAEVMIFGDARHPMRPDPHSDETRPQPTVPICPNCTVRKQSSDWYLYLDLDVDLIGSGARVYPTLTLRDEPNNSYIEVQLGSITAYTGPRVLDLQSTPLTSWLDNGGFNGSLVTTGLLGLKIVPSSGSESWHVAVVDVVP